MKDKKDMYLWLQVDNDVTVPDIRSALSDKGITRCILHPLPEYDWQAFRREAAKDILVGLCANNNLGFYGDSNTALAASAITLADELLKQLKGDEK